MNSGKALNVELFRLPQTTKPMALSDRMPSLSSSVRTPPTPTAMAIWMPPSSRATATNNPSATVSSSCIWGYSFETSPASGAASAPSGRNSLRATTRQRSVIPNGSSICGSQSGVAVSVAATILRSIDCSQRRVT